MPSSHENIVRAEEEERDSLECSEDSLKEKTTVTAIGKVGEISIPASNIAWLGESRTVYICMDPEHNSLIPSLVLLKQCRSMFVLF